MRKYFIFLFILYYFCPRYGFGEKVRYDCDYLGQKPPGEIPVKFAPGIVSTKAWETSVFFSVDGNEIYFTRDHCKLMVIKKDKIKNVWGIPHQVSFGGIYFQIGEANISPDGKKLFFNCRKAVPGAKVALTLWTAERFRDSWGQAQGMKPPLNNQVMHAVAIAPNGSIYASGIRMSKLIENEFATPIKLKIKGGHPFLPSNGKYLIFTAQQPNGKNSDLYVAFKDLKGDWENPKHLGYQINTPSGESNAAVSPDGKYIFFQREGDIYWAKADFLLKLKSNKEVE